MNEPTTTRRALVVGGASGIGLAMAMAWAEDPAVERVYIVDKAPLKPAYRHPKVEAFQFDITETDHSFFDRFADIDTLMLTAGFGRLDRFRDIDESLIARSFEVNTVSVLRLIRRFYTQLEGRKPFRCGVMSSIAGFVSSPFLAVYGATKAALRSFIESVNVELSKAGTDNRILCVAPGSIQGTGFTGGETQLEQVMPLAREIISHLDTRDDLFIPLYDEVFRAVIQRYHEDFRAEGAHSYDYKVATGRMKL